MGTNVDVATQAPFDALQSEWLDLRRLVRYACVSERTLRMWIRRPNNPLPAKQVGQGKILVKRTEFDRWLQAQPVESAINLNEIVDDVMKEITRVQ